MSGYRAAVADSGRGALLSLRLSSRARATRLDGLHGDTARLRVAAPPVVGRANSTALSFLASVLGVRGDELELVRGLRHRDKTVLVRGVDAATVAERLRRAAASGRVG